MSTNLPIVWQDKVNSPALLAYFQQFGEEIYLSAEEINQIKRAINELGLPDGFIKTTPLTRVGNVVSIAALDFKWILNHNVLENTIPFSTNILPATDGKYRSDILVANTLGSFSLYQGPEDAMSAIQIPTPEDTLFVTVITVYGSNIISIVNPNSSGYITKKEKAVVEIAGGGNSISVSDESAFFEITGFTGPINYVYNQGSSYVGKIYTIKNKTGSNLTITHNSTSSENNKKFFTFPNTDNFVLKPNEQIDFRETSNGRLDYIGANYGDMATYSIQNVTALKTFYNGKFGLRNVANTFTSFFQSLATASRTYIFPDKSGTVALLSDITLKPLKTAKWWAIGGTTATTLSQQGSFFDYPLLYTGTKQTPTTATYNSVRMLLSISRLVYRSAATASASCGIKSGKDNVWHMSRRLGFNIRMLFDTSDLTPALNSRISVGVINQNLDIGAVDSSSKTNCILLANDASDSNLYIMHNDTSGICTKIDLGSNFPHNTINCFYELIINCDSNSSSISWIVNRYLDTPISSIPAYTATGLITTNLPADISCWIIHRDNIAETTSVELGVTYVELTTFY